MVVVIKRPYVSDAILHSEAVRPLNIGQRLPVVDLWDGVCLRARNLGGSLPVLDNRPSFLESVDDRFRAHATTSPLPSPLSCIARTCTCSAFSASTSTVGWPIYFFRCSSVSWSMESGRPRAARAAARSLWFPVALVSSASCSSGMVSNSFSFDIEFNTDIHHH